MPIFKKHKPAQIVDIDFNIHKFTGRERPTDPSNIIVISCFSEFGCEVVGALYCIPRIIAEHPGLYIIVMGWYGRAYLYQHLADEFWETKEEVQWLRDSALAFHHNNKNLKRIEKAVSEMGKIVAADALGRIAVGNKCHQCFHFWGQIDKVEACPKCKSSKVTKALFADIRNWKKRVTPIPRPSAEKMELAKSFIQPNSVGVVARNRSTYGRNLQPEFYVKLVKLLQDMGHHVVWFGEKQSTLACPVEGVTDMSRRPEARDLELTLAVVSQLEFTVQFWTASTRLAAVMGTPYLIFESPDQLFGAGQEAYRLSLCTMGRAKIVLSHFLNVFNNHDGAIALVRECVEEMKADNWRLKVGMIDAPEVVNMMINGNRHRLAELL